MTVHPLGLRTITGQDAEAHRVLGRGLRLPFDVAGEQGSLQIIPGDGPPGGTPVTIQCAHGPFSLSEAGAVLSLFGECPVSLPADPGPDDDWFWSLFHQSLSPTLRDAFGFIRPVGLGTAEGLSCRLEVRLGDAVIANRLTLPAATALGLAQAAAWQCDRLPMPDTFAWDAPLLLGRLSLPLAQLRALAPGDLLLPEEALFDPAGHGHLRLGRYWLDVRIESSAAPLCLTVLAIEETTLSNTDDTGRDNDPWNDQLPAAELSDLPEEDASYPHEHGRFDELPIALTLRCGRLRMTLGELRALGPGAVLDVEGVAPGDAALFYGERVVAHGELVEVEGRLGFQVTRVDVAG
jgi:type III secretion protein Q